MRVTEGFVIDCKTKGKLKELQSICGDKNIDDTLKSIIDFVHEIQYQSNKYGMKPFLLSDTQLSEVHCRWVKI